MRSFFPPCGSSAPLRVGVIVAGVAGAIVSPPGVSIVVELTIVQGQICGWPSIWGLAMRASCRHCHRLHMHSSGGCGGTGGAPTRMRTRRRGC